MAEPNPNSPVLVDIRIEGKTTTIFEGTVKTCGHDVAAETGGTHPADGRNGNEYPFKVPTCTAALADAATEQQFNWDGTFYPSPIDDFFITSIKDETAIQGSEYWQLALNFKRANLGGGQLRIATGDSVVWALIEYQQGPANGLPLLKLRGPRAAEGDFENNEKAKFTVTAIDGDNREAIRGATIVSKIDDTETDVGTTDYQGNTEIEYSKAGDYELKAKRHGEYVRSNVLKVSVTQKPSRGQ